LDELLPKYMESVPTPTAGVKSWNYNLTGDGDTFYLGFSLPRDATWHGLLSCSYDPRQGFWYLDQKAGRNDCSFRDGSRRPQIAIHSTSSSVIASLIRS